MSTPTDAAASVSDCQISSAIGMPSRRLCSRVRASKSPGASTSSKPGAGGTARTRRNTPQQIKVATPWYKPGNNATGRVPDYYLHETGRWLVFPHEVTGLTEDELAAGKRRLHQIIQEVVPR